MHRRMPLSANNSKSKRKTPNVFFINQWTLRIEKELKRTIRKRWLFGAFLGIWDEDILDWIRLMRGKRQYEEYAPDEAVLLLLIMGYHLFTLYVLTFRGNMELETPLLL